MHIDTSIADCTSTAYLHPATPRPGGHSARPFCCCCCCRKGDVWVVSNHPLLHNPSTSGVGDRTRQPWVALCRSEWHGPDRDGKFQVDFLPGCCPAGLQKQQAVYALKGPDVATDLLMAQFLAQHDLAAVELLPALLQHSKGLGPAAAAAAGQGAAAADDGANACEGTAGAGQQGQKGQQDEPAWLQEVLQRFRLNPEQGDVLRYVSKWLQANPARPRPAAGALGSKLAGAQRSRLHAAGTAAAAAGRAAGTAAGGAASVPPVCLVHGPFGSGKSTLLVALIHLISSAGKAAAQVPASAAGAAVATKQAAAGPAGRSRAREPALDTDSSDSDDDFADAAEAAAAAAQAAPAKQQQQAAPAAPAKRKTPAAAAAAGQAPGLRILVAAHTNVAVDRALLGLLEEGFTDIVRVGSLQRIAKQILPVGPSSEDAVGMQLNEMQWGCNMPSTACDA